MLKPRNFEQIMPALSVHDDFQLAAHGKLPVHIAHSAVLDKRDPYASDAAQGRCCKQLVTESGQMVWTVHTISVP